MSPSKPEPSETALQILRDLSALAHRSLPCRYDVRLSTNPRGHQVVVLLWGDDPDLPLEPAVFASVRGPR